jgi:ABC-type transporter lipoprotein component MlaA
MTGTSRGSVLLVLALFALAAPAGAQDEATAGAEPAAAAAVEPAVEQVIEPAVEEVVEPAVEEVVEPAAPPPSDESWLDGANRASREFNFWMFDHVLEPASRGYNYVMPKWGQQRIQNFFENLERPRDVINSLLQGKGRRAGNHMAAFLVNTTAGLAGLFVISDHFIDIEPPETTNETLGVYGIPPGPYLVIPLYGESCPRCLLGSLGDAVMYPIFWVPGQAGTYAGIAARGLNAVNLVAKQMPSPFADDSEWSAYHERLHDRHAYEEAKRLFFENQALDVED